MEVVRLNDYYRKDFQIYPYQTTAGGEIDLVFLILELPDFSKTMAIKIKSFLCGF